MRAGVGGDLGLSAGSPLEPSLEAHWQDLTIRTGTMGIMLRLRSTTITTRRRQFITDITARARTAVGAGAMALATGFADLLL